MFGRVEWPRDLGVISLTCLMAMLWDAFRNARVGGLSWPATFQCLGCTPCLPWQLVG